MSASTGENGLGIQGMCLMLLNDHPQSRTDRMSADAVGSDFLAHRPIQTDRSWPTVDTAPIWVRTSPPSLPCMLTLLDHAEGPWAEVSQAIHDCHAAVHAKGAPRIATDIRIGTRVDKQITPGTGNAHKVARVDEILGQHQKSNVVRMTPTVSAERCAPDESQLVNVKHHCTIHIAVPEYVFWFVFSRDLASIKATV